MGDDQHDALAAELIDQLNDFRAHGPIQSGGGFIHQQHLGVPQQLDRHGQAPLLPAAEFLGGLLEGQAAKADLLQHRLRLLAWQAPLPQSQFLADGESEEMAFGELKDQAAEPTALAGIEGFAVPADLPVAWIGQSADQLQQGGLAGATAAGHQRNPPGLQAHAGPPQDRLRSRCGVVAERVELKHRWPMAVRCPQHV